MFIVNYYLKKNYLIIQKIKNINFSFLSAHISKTETSIN